MRSEADERIDEKDYRAWWGSWSVEPDEMLHWRIGPFQLWIRRQPDEWRIAYSRGPDLLDTSLDVATAGSLQDMDAGETQERFAQLGKGQAIALAPALADRPMVTRPQDPFFLLPEDEARIYVSSPLWVRIETGAPPRVVRDVATMQPADTWFGPSTIQGELCYASRTHCRLHLQNVPFRPHRAVTAISIRNEIDKTLPLERISVPLPNLSLYEGADGLLWTESIVLTHQHGKEGLADLEIESAPPSESGTAKRIQQPRVPVGPHSLFRAFGALF